MKNFIAGIFTAFALVSGVAFAVEGTPGTSLPLVGSIPIESYPGAYLNALAHGRFGNKMIVIQVDEIGRVICSDRSQP
jgi:hypothetical protein